MRYLNRIIFINSAHVPYAEIKLDGNVHFIGTQGVGKSTLLRSILFFYNVDKSKLGIRTQDKQKPYDEFYLPYPNSYIIYEVCRENSCFFVMTFISRGRTAFRIVDCAFDKRFFIGDDGNVRYEWGRISEQIGVRVFKSNIIHGYEDFRDIIYGNWQNVAKELRRFCILESPKYQNVPRTIQNIFLNQSLESRVIKDTIIDSMDFAGDGLDLNFYREHVKNFRQQYEDIWKWYKREKNGKVKVQAEAENVISRYAQYEYTRRIIAELCGNLNFALERDMERLPLIKNQEKERSAELNRKRTQLEGEAKKYSDERDKLNRDDGALKSFLDIVKSKRQHYAEIGIDAIAAKIDRENELKLQKASLENQQRTLTDKNQGVKAKYDALQQEADHQLREYKIQARQKVNEIDQETMELIARLQLAWSENQETIRTTFQQKLDENRQQEKEAAEEKGDCRLREQKVQRLNPFEDAMAELKKKISEQQARCSQCLQDASLKLREIDRITNEVALRRKDLENECDREISQIENDIRIVSEAVQKCEDLLNRQQGSLVEWLGENVEGWEETIGKVLDEEAVLYNTALNPRLSDAADSIYGVRIDVRNIDKTIQTPEEIKRQKGRLEERIKELKSQLSARRQKLEKDIEELERKPSAAIKTLRMEKMTLDSESRQLPLRIENSQKELSRLEEQLQAWRKNELEAIRRVMREVETRLQELTKQANDFRLRRDRELDTLRISFNRQKKNASEESDKRKDVIKKDVEQKEQQTAIRKRELEGQMDAELKGLGVDVGQLAEVRRKLQEVNDALGYIEHHRLDYVGWLNDTKEYFDQEQAKKEERKQVRQKIDDLQNKFDVRKQKLEAEIKSLSGELRDLQDEQRKLEEAIKKVNAFLANPSCPPAIEAFGKLETAKLLSTILDELRDNISDQQRKMEEFKQSVVQFKNNFSPQNTFHFRTEFNSESDYIEFAAELNEFLSNKKIEEYRVRTSSQYATIIKRIAKEVSDLNKHNAEIKQTIGEVNRDFRENNFAGVIKEIELRAVESNDRLMQQLLNIKHFDDEYGFDIGQLNLFTNEDNLDRTNQQAVNLLMRLIDMMDAEPKRERITLSDTFKLEFKVKENDNDTNWVEKLSNVGSDGTDVLVKAMVNIMLINVFKRKISRKFGDFKLHCMMDEIGKLHPNNVEGILKFANVRNIYLINSSPTTYNAQAYKYTYSLSKDEYNNTVVKTLLTIR